MTVPSEDTRSGPYACNGSQTNFVVDFPFMEAADLEVVLIESTGAETVLTLTTNYTVAGGAVAGVPAAGSITTLATYATGRSIGIRRAPVIKQTVNLGVGAGVPSRTVNTALDRQTMFIQRIQDELGRVPKFRRFSNLYGTAVFPEPLNGSAIGWSGGVLANVDLAGITEYQNDADGAVERTVHDRLSDDRLSLKEFGAEGDGVANDTSAISLWVLAMQVTGKSGWIPEGVYLDTAGRSISGSLDIRGEGRTRSIIKRGFHTGGQSILWSMGGTSFSCEGVGFDGNKAGISIGCHTVYISPACVDLQLVNCTFKNAKAQSGWGSGCVVPGNETANASYIITRCIFEGNDAQGLFVEDADQCLLFSNVSRNNGTTGIEVNNYDATFAKKVRNCGIFNNISHNNGGVGFAVANFTSDNVFTGQPHYGNEDPEVLDCLFSGNIAFANAGYGASLSGWYVMASGNSFNNNLGDGALFLVTHGALIGNTIRGNSGSGVDAGACSNSIIANNNIRLNGAFGANIGGSPDIEFTGNIVGENGGSTGVQVNVEKVEGDGVNTAFDVPSARLLITNNLIIGSSNRVGIRAVDGIEQCWIVNNFFDMGDVNNCIYAILKSGIIQGNRPTPGTSFIVARSSNNLNVPDVFDYCIDNTAGGTIASIRTKTASVIADGVAWCNVTAPGSGYSTSSPPTVTISPVSGGSGATAHVQVGDNGSIRGIIMDSFGSGYANGATVAISGAGGATATAQVGLPVLESKELTVYINQGATVTRVTTPAVDSPSLQDIVVPALGHIKLVGFSGGWRVLLADRTSLYLGTDKLLGAPKAGWGVPTTTLSRAALATFTQSISASPTQAEVQALRDQIILLTQTLGGVINDIHVGGAGSPPHGLFKT